MGWVVSLTHLLSHPAEQSLPLVFGEDAQVMEVAKPIGAASHMNGVSSRTMSGRRFTVDFGHHDNDVAHQPGGGEIIAAAVDGDGDLTHHRG